MTLSGYECGKSELTEGNLIEGRELDRRENLTKREVDQKGI
jgi:hypothetical protein